MGLAHCLPMKELLTRGTYEFPKGGYSENEREPKLEGQFGLEKRLQSAEKKTRLEAAEKKFVCASRSLPREDNAPTYQPRSGPNEVPIESAVVPSNEPSEPRNESRSLPGEPINDPREQSNEPRA
jgi:hypothetical protein